MSQTSLFSPENNPSKNLLPYDGEVYYYGKIFSKNKADNFLSALLEKIEWKNDHIFIYGKHIITQRKVAWYGDKAFEYTYSQSTKKALPWTDELMELKVALTHLSGENYNSCLLNLYHDGSEGMSWHSDNESNLKEEGAIASLSFGAERKFLFKHKKTKEKISFILANGSLLVMKGKTQKYWFHSLPTSKKIITPRVNLTFRTII